jgi:hypothetical protein
MGVVAHLWLVSPEDACPGLKAALKVAAFGGLRCIAAILPLGADPDAQLTRIKRAIPRIRASRMRQSLRFGVNYAFRLNERYVYKLKLQTIVYIQ